MRTVVFTLTAFMIFLLPVFAQAALVPCGLSSDDPSTVRNEMLPCNTCHAFILVNNIIAWVVGIASALAALFVIVGGFLLLTSEGNPNKVDQGKKTLFAVAAGYGLVLASWLIVQTAFTTFGAKTFQGVQGWSSIQCDPAQYQATRLFKPSARAPLPGTPGFGIACMAPTNSGECATSKLVSVWGSLASQASQVCQLESRGEGRTLNTSCLQGGACDFSGGLFQYNLVGRCPGGLVDFNRSTDSKGIISCSCVISDVNILNACLQKIGASTVNAQGNPIGGTYNTAKQSEAAKEVYNQAGNWSPWYISATTCNLPH